MSEKRVVVKPSGAPAVLGPYSLAIKTEQLVFLSGTIGVNPDTGSLVEGGVAAEARQALTNMQNILKAAGSGMGAVLKTTVFLTDIED